MGLFVFTSCDDQKIPSPPDDNLIETPTDSVGNDKPVEVEPEENGHKYVDLGLSVKWATCNIGGSRPTDIGGYYAWGEKSAKSKYDWDTYKFCKSPELTKYFEFDGKKLLDIEDDIARAMWGGAWRMPTKEEQYELHVNCTWVWTTENYVQGYRVTSNIEGYTDRSIFLPASGLKIGSSRSGVDEYGCYWSSTRAPSQNCALVLNFGSHYIATNFEVSRAKGCSVRAVFK